MTSEKKKFAKEIDRVVIYVCMWGVFDQDANVLLSDLFSLLLVMSQFN